MRRTVPATSEDRSRRRSVPARFGGNVDSSVPADDQREQLVVGDVVDAREPRTPAVAQHGDAVGELADLGEPVGDVDDGGAPRRRRRAPGRRAGRPQS